MRKTGVKVLARQIRADYDQAMMEIATSTGQMPSMEMDWYEGYMFGIDDAISGRANSRTAHDLYFSYERMGRNFPELSRFTGGAAQAIEDLYPQVFGGA